MIRPARPHMLVLALAVAMAFLAAAPTLALAAKPPTVQGQPQPATPAAQAVNAFGFDLYDHLAKNTGNVLYSPLSLSTALTMTRNGAAGATAAQMDKALHLPPIGSLEQANKAFADLQNQLNGPTRTPAPAPGAAPGASGKRPFELAIANALWPAQGAALKPDYLQRVTQQFGATLDPLNFAGNPKGAADTINQWAARKTQDKIKTIVDARNFNDGTRLVLTNAVYFKGLWKEPFSKSGTQDAEFTLATGGKAKVPMMNQRLRLPHAKVEGAQAVELPYKGDQLSMVVILPDDPAAAMGFRQVQLKAVLAALDQAGGHGKEVVLSLPRFKVNAGYDLNDQLIALGMADAFNAELADFSAMSEREKLMITFVKHKAFIDVNEEGTEAAAVTAIGIKLAAAPPSPIIFRVDRPFLFALRDRQSGAILFLGRVTDPRG